jgi:hypothetical protein
MSWEPSVRTRHLAVIIILVILVTGALLCFNIASMLNAQIAPKENQPDPGYFPAAADNFLDQLFTFAQRAIYNRPLEEEQVAIGLDEGVRSMIKASTGKEKDFVYCAMKSTDDGAIIAQSDPLNILQSVGKIRPIEELQAARWYKQLWMIYRDDDIYELKNTLKFRGKDFAQVITGVQASTLRAKISPTIKLSMAVGVIIIGLCVLVALLSSNLVLWPLREVMESVEQLEAESTMQTESRPVNIEMQSSAAGSPETALRLKRSATSCNRLWGVSPNASCCSTASGA